MAEFLHSDETAPASAALLTEPPGETSVAAPVSETVGAGEVRRILRLTPHQLGELTARLALDVGDRPNYPRYPRHEVRLLVAATALRRLRVPLDDACAAMTSFRDLWLSPTGWLLLYPDGDRWVALGIRRLEDAAGVLARTGGGTLLDVPALAAHADDAFDRCADRR